MFYFNFLQLFGPTYIMKITLKLFYLFMFGYWQQTLQYVIKVREGMKLVLFMFKSTIFIFVFNFKAISVKWYWLTRAIYRREISIYLSPMQITKAIIAWGGYKSFLFSVLPEETKFCFFLYYCVKDVRPPAILKKNAS